MVRKTLGALQKICFVFTFWPVTLFAQTNSIEVNGFKATPVDGMAYEGEFLGKPSVTVFLFSQKIDKEKASQVALSSFPSQDKCKIAVRITPSFS